MWGEGKEGGKGVQTGKTEMRFGFCRFSCLFSHKIYSEKI